MGGASKTQQRNFLLASSRRILARSTIKDTFLAKQLRESRRTKTKRHASVLPCCCCSYLEQSAAACHVHILGVCFPRSPQNFLSLGVPSHYFHRNISSACTVTLVIFGHFNRSFYLITLSLTHSLAYLLRRLLATSGNHCDMNCIVYIVDQVSVAANVAEVTVDQCDTADSFVGFRNLHILHQHSHRISDLSPAACHE